MFGSGTCGEDLRTEPMGAASTLRGKAQSPSIWVQANEEEGILTTIGEDFGGEVYRERYPPTLRNCASSTRLRTEPK